jgi:site-specific recombinase XerD
VRTDPHLENNKRVAMRVISIFPTSIRIFKKYNFELPKYTNQYFNQEFKAILKYYELFPQIEKKTIVKNGKTETTEYLKRELISSHTCRRSFITNAISKNVSLNAIQASTGNTQLSTLSKYVKRNQNKDQMKAID